MHTNNSDTNWSEFDEVSPSHVSERKPSLRDWEFFAFTWYQFHHGFSHIYMSTSDHKLEFQSREVESEAGESSQEREDYMNRK